MSHPNIIGIIPARYGSTRFPGKPLALIHGKPMVCHVYQRAAEALGRDNVFVATDDVRIKEAVENHGGKAVITPEKVENGTARCAAAVRMLESKPDIVINIQGDEPFIDPEDIRLIADSFSDPSVKIATLARKFLASEGFDALFSPDSPKVVADDAGFALYFSRSIIPYVRDIKWQEWGSSANFLIHVGTYGFRREVLDHIVTLPEAAIERAEKLEQLRWLAAGYRIKIVLTENNTFSIDTPADLEKIDGKTR